MAEIEEQFPLPPTFSLIAALDRLTHSINSHEQALKSNTAVLQQIADDLKPKPDMRPVKLQVNFEGEKKSMSPEKAHEKDAAAAAQVQEGLLIGASDTEFNAEGDQVPAADPTKLSYAVDDTTIAQVLTNADDPTIPVGSARIKGLKVGKVNVTSTDSAVTPPLVSAPLELDVTLDPVANSLVVTLA